jgi:hypothetical protein
LITSTVFTLLALPTFYVAAQRLRNVLPIREQH